MSRYWLVKIDDTYASDARSDLQELFGGTAEIVEITPEQRDSNWMERALVAHLAKND